MRAHGASDVDGFGADDDSLGDEASAQCLGADQWDTVGTSATHAYALRANPNRLIRSCQLCKNCGKEFTSWELFLQHVKCNSEDEGEEEVNGSCSLRSSSPPSDADGEEDPAVAAAWSKGKRSRRVRAEEPSTLVPPERCTLGEEEDLANCLIMLSSSPTTSRRLLLQRIIRCQQVHLSRKVMENRHCNRNKSLFSHTHKSQLWHCLRQ